MLPCESLLARVLTPISGLSFFHIEIKIERTKLFEKKVSCASLGDPLMQEHKTLTLSYYAHLFNCILYSVYSVYSVWYVLEFFASNACADK